MLSEMLDAVRWPAADPWNANASQAGRAVPPLSGSPSHRANHIATAALSSHPYRPLYLSGRLILLRLELHAEIFQLSKHKYTQN